MILPKLVFNLKNHVSNRFAIFFEIMLAVAFCSWVLPNTPNIFGNSVSLAQNPPTVKISSHDSQIELGSDTTVNVELSNVEAETVKLAIPDNFEIVGRRQSQSYSMTFGSGSNSKTTYSFQLRAIKEGSVAIGPFSFSANGKEFKSNQIKIKVIPVGSGQSPQQNGTQPKESLAQGNLKGKAKETTEWLETEISNLSPYENERVSLAMRFYYRSKISNVKLVETAFPNFDIIEGKEVLQRAYTKRVDGVEYNVLEIIRGLSPTKSGKLDFPKLKIGFEKQTSRRGLMEDDEDDFLGGGSVFNSFFGRTESRIVESQTITLDVKPLPKPPPDFSGAVGTVNLKQELSQSKLGVGDNITLSVALDGNADLSRLNLSKFDSVPELKLYPDKPVSQRTLDFDGKVQESRQYKIGIVAVKPGQFKVPVKKVIYFNPASANYESLDLGGQLLIADGTEQNISSQPETQKPQVEKEEIKQLSVDIRSQKNLGNNFNFQKAKSKTVWFWMFHIPALVLLLSAGSWKVLKDLLASSNFVSSLGRSNEKKRFLNQLNETIENAISGNYKMQQDALIHQVLSDVLKWISCELRPQNPLKSSNLNHENLTASDVRSWLGSTGYADNPSKNSIVQLVNLTENLEAFRYRGTQLPEQEFKEILQKLKRLIIDFSSNHREGNI